MQPEIIAPVLRAELQNGTKNTAAGSAVIPEKIRNRNAQVSEMFEELNDTIKQILEESEHAKEVAAAAFFRIYEAVDKIADDPQNRYQEEAAKLRKLLEDTYAVVECFEYGRTD